MPLLEFAETMRRVVRFPSHLNDALLKEAYLLARGGRADTAEDLVTVLAKVLEHLLDELWVLVLARECDNPRLSIDTSRAMRPEAPARVLNIFIMVAIDQGEL